MTTPSSHSTSAVIIGLRAIYRRFERPWSSLTGAPCRETKGPMGAVTSRRRGLEACYVDVDRFWSRGRQQRLRILHPSRGAESTRAAGATPDLRSTAPPLHLLLSAKPCSESELRRSLKTVVDPQGRGGPHGDTPYGPERAARGVRNGKSSPPTGQSASDSRPGP